MGEDRTLPGFRWPDWWHKGRLGRPEQLRELVDALWTRAYKAEVRLREAEAERDRLQRAFSAAAEAASTHGGRELEYMARAERAEAELREAREALRDLDLRPGLSDLGMALTIAQDHGAGAFSLVIDTMWAAHGLLREEQARLDRARGVLENGAQQADEG
jgi:hypothetical protein